MNFFNSNIAHTGTLDFTGVSRGIPSETRVVVDRYSRNSTLQTFQTSFYAPYYYTTSTGKTGYAKTAENFSSIFSDTTYCNYVFYYAFYALKAGGYTSLKVIYGKPKIIYGKPEIIYGKPEIVLGQAEINPVQAGTGFGQTEASFGQPKMAPLLSKSHLWTAMIHFWKGGNQSCSCGNGFRTRIFEDSFIR